MYDFLREVLEELRSLSGGKRPVIPDEKVFINFLPILKELPGHVIIVLLEVLHVLEGLKNSEQVSDLPNDHIEVAKEVANATKEASIYQNCSAHNSA